jgi:hypothetical protein
MPNVLYTQRHDCLKTIENEKLKYKPCKFLSKFIDYNIETSLKQLKFGQIFAKKLGHFKRNALMYLKNKLQYS